MVPLGSLPEFNDQIQTYDLRSGGRIPADATEVLVYTFVTTHGDGPFQRGYYDLSTCGKGGQLKFTQYLNVATGQGVMAVNSANLWFPVADGMLNAKLIYAADGNKRSIAGRSKSNTEWSGVFVIGYRS